PNFLRRALLAMVLGGLALQVKYTVLPQCLVLGGWVLCWRWRHGVAFPRLAAEALAFAALGLLPTALVALFYAVQGHFDAWLFANVLSFFERMPAPQGRWAPSHALGIAPLAILVGGGIYAVFRFRNPSDWQV